VESHVVCESCVRDELCSMWSHMQCVSRVSEMSSAPCGVTCSV